MIPTPAAFLLRLDDLCPMFAKESWRRFESLISEFQLQPILAIVPDNRDPELQASPPDAGFWERMRRLEASGAMIGLHGYRHLCWSRGRSLLGLSRASEFTGVPAETQREWIATGLRILRGQGLNPRIFVAPRHGFDKHTLGALRAEGINLLSDGFARVPFVRGGLTWIPQQLWGPVDKPNGVWTICLHPNTASDEDVSLLRAFLTAYSDQFTSVDRVLFHVGSAILTLPERLYAEAALRRLKTSRAVRRLRQLARF